MNHNTTEMARLAADVRRFAVAGAVHFMVQVHAGTVRKPPPSPGTPVDRGEARGGGRVALHSPPTFKPDPNATTYQIAGADHVRKVMRGMKIGDRVFWGNRVDHAGILDEGRRFSPTLGRMIGSVQAPDGFLRQSHEGAGQRLKSWRYKPRAREAT